MKTTSFIKKFNIIIIIKQCLGYIINLLKILYIYIVYSIRSKIHDHKIKNFRNS